MVISHLFSLMATSTCAILMQFILIWLFINNYLTVTLLVFQIMYVPTFFLFFVERTSLKRIADVTVKGTVENNFYNFRKFQVLCDENLWR